MRHIALTRNSPTTATVIVTPAPVDGVDALH
jgi:hypothetical protein